MEPVDATPPPRLIHQLRLLLIMAGARPRNWVTSTVLVSLLLATLDTLGVAAMVPLTQLISGAEPSGGVLGLIADALGTDAPSVLIPVVAGIVALLFVVKSLLSIVFRWWLLGRTTRVSALTAVELMRGYVLAPYSAHRARRTNEIYRNINDSTVQGASVLLAIVSLSTDLLVLFAIVVILAITAPIVTLLVVILFAGFIFGLQRALRQRQSGIGEELAAASLQSWQFLLPGLDGFREARLTASASSFVDGFRTAKLRSARAARSMAIVSEAPRYALEVVFVVAIAGISIVLFVFSTPAQAVTVLGVFAAASLRALPTLNRVSANLATVRSGRVGLTILTTTAERLAREGEHEELPRGARFLGDVVVRDLTFQYPDADGPVLDSLSLTIPQNHTTAFVGASGAGKSTLIDLVLGLLEPSQGGIECGGRPILDDRAAWYAGLGVVPQDVFLVNDTIAANIAFGQGAESLDRGRLFEVIRLAQLEQLVRELPAGVDTVVGERGVRLSGGQRQRLGLARALYRRPSVLVLDEATSALDNATEHEISETLAGLRGTMTILIVAHRLSTVRSADMLVFLKDGRIEVQGTFEQVRANSADFARLVELGDLG